MPPATLTDFETPQHSDPLSPTPLLDRAGEGARHRPSTLPLVDERAARVDLRRQIAKLEATLGDTVLSAPPGTALPPAVPRRGDGARLLSVEELERARDELVERIASVRGVVDAADAGHAAAGRLLEDMYADPARHRWVMVRNTDLGLEGCKSYHVRPRLGLIGMLAGWWQVKISSGCPLPLL